MESGLVLTCIFMITFFTTKVTCVPPSPCATLECPAVVSEAANDGSGDEEVETESLESRSARYSIQIAKKFTAEGEKLEVTLQFAQCIPFSDDESVGPQWYKLEAVTSAESSETLGEFDSPLFNSEAQLCPNNVISFKTKSPTVLDMPRSYRWRSTKIIKAVCFRATIFHFPQKSCETVTKCVSGTDLPSPNTPWTPFPDRGIIVIPTEKQIKKCNDKWKCHLPSYKNITHCACDEDTDTCVTYPKKCEMRKHECIYDMKYETKTKGVCPEKPTTPPTPSPPSPPIYGYCQRFKSTHSHTCTSTGDYKVTQCDKNTAGEGYKCYCVTYDFAIKHVSSERTITSCDSPSTYDLKCLR